jgi:hypothetical protein
VRRRLSGLIVRYIEAREAFNAAGEDAAALARADAWTDAMQGRIWNEVVTAVRATPGATTNTPLLLSINEMFDLAASRRAALDVTVPPVVLWTLIGYAAVAAVVTGYSMPLARPLRVVSIIVVLLVTLAISLVLDLDRPRTGLITLGGEPLIRIAASVRAMERAKAPTPTG